MDEIQQTKQKKLKKTIPNLDLKSGQYFLRRRAGMTKSQAARSLGITPENVPNTERSKNFQALEETYAAALKNRITYGELAQEQIKNALQDADRGAKNTAIKQIADRIDPIISESFGAGEVNIIIKAPQG